MRVVAVFVFIVRLIAALRRRLVDSLLHVLWVPQGRETRRKRQRPESRGLGACAVAGSVKKTRFLISPCLNMGETRLARGTGVFCPLTLAPRSRQEAEHGAALLT